jgi:uncharacterized membrane protein
MLPITIDHVTCTRSKNNLEMLLFVAVQRCMLSLILSFSRTATLIAAREDLAGAGLGAGGGGGGGG